MRRIGGFDRRHHAFGGDGNGAVLPGGQRQPERADIDGGIFGHGQIGAGDELAAHFHRHTAGGFHTHLAGGDLHQPGVPQHHGQIGQLDIAIRTSANGQFGLHQRAGANDVPTIGALGDLANDKAHARLPLTSTGTRK